MSAPFHNRIDELDALSRERALTYAESLELEREIRFANGDRLPSGLTRALARQGIKRGMQRFIASADTRPKGGAATEIAAPFTSGAVPREDEADAQS